MYRSVCKRMYATCRPGQASSEAPSDEAKGSWAAGQHAVAVQEASMQAVLQEQETDMAAVLASQRQVPSLHQGG